MDEENLAGPKDIDPKSLNSSSTSGAEDSNPEKLDFQKLDNTIIETNMDCNTEDSGPTNQNSAEMSQLILEDENSSDEDFSILPKKSSKNKKPAIDSDSENSETEKNEQTNGIHADNNDSSSDNIKNEEENTSRKKMIRKKLTFGSDSENSDDNDLSMISVNKNGKNENEESSKNSSGPKKPTSVIKGLIDSDTDSDSDSKKVDIKNKNQKKSSLSGSESDTLKKSTFSRKFNAKSTHLQGLIDSDSDGDVAPKKFKETAKMKKQRILKALDDSDDEKLPSYAREKDKKGKKKLAPRKSKLSAIEEISSVTQKLIRESNLSLPYHIPKQRTLEEFLAFSNNKKPVLPEGPTLAAKMYFATDIVCKYVEEKEKEIPAFFKSDSEDEDLEKVLPDTQNDNDIEKSDPKEPEVLEQEHPNSEEKMLSTETPGETIASSDISAEKLSDPVTSQEENSIVKDVEEENKDIEKPTENKKSFDLDSLDFDFEDTPQPTTTETTTPNDKLIFLDTPETGCIVEPLKTSNQESCFSHLADDEITSNIEKNLNPPKIPEESESLNLRLDSSEFSPQEQSTPIPLDFKAMREMARASAKKITLRPEGDVIDLDIDYSKRGKKDNSGMTMEFSPQKQSTFNPMNYKAIRDKVRASALRKLTQKSTEDVVDLDIDYRKRGKIDNASVMTKRLAKHTENDPKPQTEIVINSSGMTMEFDINCKTKPGYARIMMMRQLKKESERLVNEQWARTKLNEDTMVKPKDIDSETEADSPSKSDDEKEEESENEDEESEIEEEECSVVKEKKRKHCDFADEEAEVDDEEENECEEDEEDDEEDADDEGDNDVTNDEKEEDDEEDKVEIPKPKTLRRITKAFEEDDDDDENLELKIVDENNQKNDNKNRSIERYMSEEDIFNTQGLPTQSKDETSLEYFSMPSGSLGTDTARSSSSATNKKKGLKSWMGGPNKLFEQSQSDVSESQLMDLCSGSFPVNESESEPPSIEGLSALIGTSELEENIDSQLLMDICSGKFSTPEQPPKKPSVPNDETNSPKLTLENKGSRFQNKIITSDSEDEDFGEEKARKVARNRSQPMIISDDEDEEQNEMGDSDESEIEEEEEEEDVHYVDYDSEENEIVVPAKDISKVTNKFFEAEAGVSDSELGSEDEDEKGLDQYEDEMADAEAIDEDEQRDHLGQILAKQTMDDDNRIVKKIKERFVDHDDDSDNDGPKRVRQYRWKDIDDFDDMKERDAKPMSDDEYEWNDTDADNQDTSEAGKFNIKDHLVTAQMKINAGKFQEILRNNPYFSEGMDKKEKKLDPVKKVSPITVKTPLEPFLESQGTLSNILLVSAMKTNPEEAKRIMRGSFLNPPPELMAKYAKMCNYSSKVNLSTNPNKYMIFRPVTKEEKDKEDERWKERNTMNHKRKVNLEETPVNSKKQKVSENPQYPKKLFTSDDN